MFLLTGFYFPFRKSEQMSQSSVWFSWNTLKWFLSNLAECRHTPIWLHLLKVHVYFLQNVHYWKKQAWGHRGKTGEQPWARGRSAFTWWQTEVLLWGVSCCIGTLVLGIWPTSYWELQEAALGLSWLARAHRPQSNDTALWGVTWVSQQHGVTWPFANGAPPVRRAMSGAGELLSFYMDSNFSK